MVRAYTRYRAGMEIAGSRLVRRSGRKVQNCYVWECECLACGASSERSTMALNNAAKRGRVHGGLPAGCKGCASASLSGSLRESARLRREAMVAAFAAGEGVVELAARYGVSKQRVQQVVSRGVGPQAVDGLLRQLAVENPRGLAEAVCTLRPGDRRRVLMRLLGHGKAAEGAE